MGTYNLPRNVKGENRILFIFSTKSLIYTVVAAGIGLIKRAIKFKAKGKKIYVYKEGNNNDD